MNLKLNVNKMAFLNHSIRFRSVNTLITNLPEVLINKTYIYIFPLILLGRKPEKSGYICIFFFFLFLFSFFFLFFFFLREPCEGKTFQKDTSNISYDVNFTKYRKSRFIDPPEFLLS